MAHWPNFNNSLESRRSFTLLETIVAIYVLVSGIVGIMTLASENIKVLSYFRDQLIGANLAQEGAELVRNKRDSNFINCAKDFSPCDGVLPGFDYNSQNMDGLVGAGCEAAGGCRIHDSFDASLVFEPCTGDCSTQRLLLDSNGQYGYISGTPTKYNRKIEVTQVPGYSRGALYDWRVKVTVSWRDRLVDRWVEVNDVLTPNGRY